MTSTAHRIQLASAKLADLAETANREQHAALMAGASIVEHAIAAGTALLEARAATAPGEWLSWADANIDADRHTISDYMRIAHHKDLVREAGLQQLKQAMLYLRGLSSPQPHRGNGVRNHSLATRREALRLLDSGVRVTEVARLLGVTYVTVRGWHEPEYAQRRLRLMRERKHELREIKAAARERAVKAAARKSGGAIAEAYALAERMQDVLGRAHLEAEDREARVALSLSGEHYRKMRDEIVRALGVS